MTGTTWTPDAVALVAARQRKGWSRERLASAAGVSERTVRRAELGQGVGIPSVRLLAKALGVPFEEVARATTPPSGRSAERLAALVAESRRRENGPRDDARRDESRRPDPKKVKRATLTAALLESLYTTPLAYQGEVIAARGRLVRQAPGTTEEARALGVPVGVVGRFELAIALPAGEALSVTVHTARAASARVAQGLLGEAEAEIAVRVFAVEEGTPFGFFGSRRGHGWTLVVEGGRAR